MAKTVCRICEKIFEHDEAAICPECCENADVDELYNIAPRCAECQQNLATVEVDDAPYCDQHSPEGLNALTSQLSGRREDAEEFGAIETHRPVINDFHSIILHLILFYREYDVAFSKISEWLGKKYHLNSSNKVDSAFLLFVSAFFYWQTRTMMEKNDFEDALKMLEFLTGPDMQESGLSQEDDVNICIWKSRCLQHAASFEEAKKVLSHILLYITDVAYYASEEWQELAESEYREAVQVLFEETYACGRREKTYLVVSELDSASSMIELKTPEEDIPILKGMGPIASLPKNLRLDDERMDSFCKKELPEMLREGESETLEFKSSVWWDHKKQCWTKELEKPVAKTVAAFMNSEGGILLIGVNDNGTVIGIEKDLEKKGNTDQFQLTLRQALDKYLGPQFCDLVTVQFKRHEENTVCRVIVKPSPKPVFLCEKGRADEFYVRSGNSSNPLTGRDQHEYIERRWGS